jgi:hypothetical protein
MSKQVQVGLVVVAVALGGVLCGFAGFGIAQLIQPTLGGDFAGGVLPSTLVTGSASGGLTGNGYVQPAGSLSSNDENGLSIGAPDQYHGLTEYITASGTPSAVVTLGAFGATTSSATTSLALPETAGLSVGAICSGSAATTTVYVSGCVLTSTNGATGTATVAYSNIIPAALSVPTSTIFRITFDQLPY